MSNKRKFFIRFASISSLLIGFLCLGISIVLIILLSMSDQVNLAKLYLVDFIFLVIGIGLFSLFVGIYEYLKAFLELEKEVVEIEEKIDKLSNKGKNAI